MKKVSIHITITGLLFFYFNLTTAFEPSSKLIHVFEKPFVGDPEADLKKQAFEILNFKCNVCHRKQNPFKVFSLKNMDKHAPKIYQQVFVYRRMPKGNQNQLTEAAYQTLKQWLKSQNIF